MKATKEVFANLIEEAVPLHKMVGIKILEATDGYVKLFIPYRPEFIGNQKKNRLHGGIIALGMDAVGGAAGITLLTSEEDKISTIDMRIDYLAPATSSDLIFIAKVIRSSNRTIVTNMEAYNVDNQNIIAEGKAVFSLRRKEDEK